MTRQRLTWLASPPCVVFSGLSAGALSVRRRACAAVRVSRLGPSSSASSQPARPTWSRSWESNCHLWCARWLRVAAAKVLSAVFAAAAPARPRPIAIKPSASHMAPGPLGGLDSVALGSGPGPALPEALCCVFGASPAASPSGAVPPLVLVPGGSPGRVGAALPVAPWLAPPRVLRSSFRRSACALASSASALAAPAPPLGAGKSSSASSSSSAFSFPSCVPPLGPPLLELRC